jgi:hypothetical protein
MKRPYLKPEHAAARLSLAFRYQHYTKEDFERVFWSDKCTTKLPRKYPYAKETCLNRVEITRG